MIKKSPLFLIALFYSHPLIAQTPTITSFSPTSGSIGTTVKIIGTNFSDTATNNIVFFGAVKADVTNANDTTLTVNVPVGTSYQPITVTTNGLTAYSTLSFNVTFLGGANGFTANSFAPKIDSPAGMNPQSISIEDLDGDGKPDIMAGNFSGSISVYKNIGVNGMISFAQKVDYSVNNNAVRIVRSGDLDGDGKPDMVVLTSTDTVFIFKNISANGTIIFAPPITFVTSISALSFCIEDIDGDGKPDIVIGGNGSGKVSVLRNVSTDGAISFTSTVSFTTGYSDFCTVAGDLDGDGKPDVVVVNAGDSTISILRNTSTPGTISFAPKTDYPTDGISHSLTLGDLNGDGKLDIVTGNLSTTVSLFKNMSTIGNIIFGDEVSYPVGNADVGIDIADLDGDGKPDIVTGAGENVFALRNTGTPGFFAFDPPVQWPTGLGVFEIGVNDLNGDGKPDIVSSNKSAASISILRNQIGDPIKINLCNYDTAFLVSNLSGVNYQWQVNEGDSFVNIPSYSNYYGNTAISQLIIYEVPASWYGYQYRCIVDGDTSNIYTLQFTDTWTGSIDSAWEKAGNWSCNSLPNSNTDVVIPSGVLNFPVLNSNASIRSLTVDSGASFTITTPYNLTVTH